MHLISYDIQDDRLRVKLAKSLIRYGMYRIQYSVFMGNITDRPLGKIRQVLAQLAQEAAWSVEDSVMILPLHQYSEEHVNFIGRSPSRWDEITGDKHTLIL